MELKSKAFTEEIPKGLVRIFLNIKSITCEAGNDAPDFIDPLDDQPHLKIVPKGDLSHLTNVFDHSYPLILDENKTRGDELVWKMEDHGIWFDVSMDKVKDIWLSEFNFYIESSKPRYLTYYIRNVEHKIQWLQLHKEKEQIDALSEFNKEFKPAPVTQKQKFDGKEVLKCADMIGRAIQKIDMRTRSALVKFNTEKGRLDPLIKGIGDKLGYDIEELDKKTVQRQREKGNNVSHSISLK